jgi:uncharacterized protein
MTVIPDQVAVANNEADSQFEAQVNDLTAFIQYRRSSDSITFLHTEVPTELEGRGLAAKLARAALEYARSAQLRVVPLCPYVAAYIRKHQEYQDLLTLHHG